MKHFETSIEGDVQHDWYADETGKVVHKRTQDIAPILANIKAEKDTGVYDRFGCEMKLAAEIPINVYHDWLKEAGYDPMVHTNKDIQVIIRKKLNDPDNRRFRVWEGHI